MRISAILIPALCVVLQAAPPESAIHDSTGDSPGIELGIPSDSASDSLPLIDVMPQLTQLVKACFPDGLVRRGIEGVVVLGLVVSESGRVDSVKVVQELRPVLDSAAARADLLTERYLKRVGSFAGQSYEEGSLVTMTDSAGRFPFKSPPPGRIKVRAIAAGCKDFTEEY